MPDQFERTKILFGSDAINALQNKKVAVFGIGGVGGYVCEALVRSGVGSFDLIDNDTVSLSNINRQIIATHSSVGKYKVDVMKERMLDINPNVKVNVYKCFYLPENASEFDFTQYDYVVDAIDTVTAKLHIIETCKRLNVPVISSMGSGNKVDPTRFRVADISKTIICPLAKVMRKELKKRHINHLKVVFSDELPMTQAEPVPASEYEGTGRRSIPGSTAFVPSAAGLVLASEVIKDLIAKQSEKRSVYPKKCACCQTGIITEPYEICEVCGWEDDKVQNSDPNFKGGSNELSLNEYRQEYERKRKIENEI